MNASSHRLCDFILKQVHALSHQGRRFVIQRIIWVWLQKQEVEAHNNCVEVEHWLPIGSQNVQTHITLHVDVWVIDLSVTVAFWSGVRIVIGNIDRELELSSSPETVFLR